MTTKADGRRLMLELDLPRIIQDAFEERPLPEALMYCMGFPGEFYLMTPDEQAGFGASLVALWDDGNFGLVVAYDQAAHAFVRFDVESSTTEIASAPRLNWQQLMVKLFATLWEDSVPGTELQRLAHELRFEHLERLVSAFEPHGLAGGEYAEWYAGFVESLSKGDASQR